MNIGIFGSQDSFLSLDRQAAAMIGGVMRRGAPGTGKYRCWCWRWR
jgi:hypothetical protein